MNRTTSFFVITACSVIIGWGGITAYNFFQNQHLENALGECTKEKEYLRLKDLSKQLEQIGNYAIAVYVEEDVKKVLDKCLGRFGLKVKM